VSNASSCRHSAVACRFAGVSVILVLNKRELFKEKIKKVEPWSARTLHYFADL
jgi:hypothetical protein